MRNEVLIKRDFRALHPWKRPQTLKGLGKPAPPAEKELSGAEIDVAKLQEAFKRSGLSKSELARRMNWLRTRPDVHRVSQYLGFETLSNGTKRKRVTYRIALRLCKAMNASPIDLGL